MMESHVSSREFLCGFMDEPKGRVKIQNNVELKFTVILHTKMSNKIFIIQRFRFPKILTYQGV